MAPADEYVSGGGKLKIKGAAGVLDGRVGKKKKKKVKKDKDKEAEGERVGEEKVDGKREGEEGGEEGEGSRSRSGSQSRGVSEGAAVVGKTEAERRYEEVRRKRLDERLKREGVKTHKERVEELNKYLSNLSEHHDMPRIGPG
ncbi:hypothetical protein FQN53_003286 [Emmonsiellopsis sp. PD_33]|nr:hypothetical protein FQN53_003286 [Emmonsiellopsis sp. PD_33]